jgi:hypothetical protein
MKKQLYLMMTLGLSASVAFAQSSREASQYMTKKGYVELSQPTKTKTVNTQKGDDLVIWSDDFSIPGLWDTYDESTPLPLGWEIISDVNASPFGGLNPIELPGAANGFAFINADAGGDPSNQNAWIEYTEPINLSGADNVTLQFLQVSRNFATEYFVEFSLDDGASWIPVQVNTELAVNTNTANPELFAVNVSDVIGGQSDVRMRFNYQADWGWFWAIDDVEIIESPDFELVLRGAYYDKWFMMEAEDPDLNNTPLVEYYPELEYSEYRQNHVRPLTFVADVENQGSQQLTDVIFQVIVNTPEGPEDYESDPITLEPGEEAFITIDDIVLNAFANGGALGEYTVEFLVVAGESEDNIDNNTRPDKSFSVSPERMANDRGNIYTSWYNDGNANEWSSMFTVEEETEVNYIQFAIINGSEGFPTEPGNEIFLNIGQGSIFEAEGPDNVVETFYGDDDLVYETVEEDISIDTLNWLTIFFPDDETVTLEPNTVYFTRITVPDYGEDLVIIPMVNQQEVFAGAWLDVDGEGGTPDLFFFQDLVPAVRAGSTIPTNTENADPLDFYMGQNYPNPIENGSTRISWELQRPAENIQFSITDNTGKLIYQKDLGDRPAGIQEDIILDDLNFAAGVYQYGLKIGNQKIVRKLIIAE